MSSRWRLAAVGMTAELRNREKCAGAIETTEASTTTEALTTPATPPGTVRHDFQCHRTMIDIFVPVTLVPNSVLTLKDPICKLRNNGTHHVFSLGYDECGTNLTYHESYVFVQNVINVHVALNGSDVQFAQDYAIPLECSVDRNKLVTSIIQVVEREGIVENKVENADFEIKEFTTAEYHEEIKNYPVQVPINREIFFELILQNSTSSIKGIYVDKCVASPSLDSNNTEYPSLLLIENGCSIHAAVKVLQSPGLSQFRFSTQAFHFTGPTNDNNKVYIHCLVSTCNPGNCDNNGCPPITRRRRSEHKVEWVALTSGAHVASTEN